MVSAFLQYGLHATTVDLLILAYLLFHKEKHLVVGGRGS